MLAFTDPERTPDPLALAARLPPGSALVYRAFGAEGAEGTAARLAAALHARGVRLLIGADAALASRVGADGVHLPERMAAQARRIKAMHPDWIVTAAAHSLRAARQGAADAAVVSAVFPSRSPSAGSPLGVLRLARIAHAAGRPVYALGGVSDANAARLKDLPLAGLAAVDAFRI